MTSTNVTHAQLVEAVKAYRAYGSRIRAEVKAGKSGMFIDRKRHFQKVLVGKLADAGHMDLVLALADEQVALDGIAFAKAFRGSVGDVEQRSRPLLRNARRKVAAIVSDVEADKPLATLPTEVVAELTAKDVVNAMGSAMTATLVKAQAAEEPAVRTGGWYLVPAEGARLTDRHDVLGPYTTEDMAEHMRKTYADEGINGVVVQSATRPVLAPREPVAIASEPHDLHMRREGSPLVYRVLGSEGRGKSCGVHMTSTKVAVYDIFRHLSDLVEDGWIACDAQGHVQDHDVSIMTLTELVRFRRVCAAMFRSPTRLADESYKSAARYTEEIDQELLLRRQTGLRAALETEASAIVAIEHGERHGYDVDSSVYSDRVESRRGIHDFLAHSGHLVRD